ncbi:aminoglycoside 6'-N-acetyltransferase [Deinobacterium chartae]|uniref:Aminoglycoside 6'-N-acetyltransferase n=1 Tax=Deinobacterium chartae TaxID=521158 RepID=A0A841I2E2_9DEIO|nr:GNAT family protein [Deinobacterium chartae]MBB6099847.1 aminoglycoside 6'-N-acetyltransferase [Deinobacterium chartae]
MLSPTEPLSPVTLSHGRVVLRPLQAEDAGPLARAFAPHADIFRYMSSSPLQPGYVEEALRLQRTGNQLPFAILVGGELAGSTRYGDVRRTDRALEIGWTFLHPRHWGSEVNTTCKLLLLMHAFETLDLLRVQIKTDLRNQRSQRAIEKLGATREGVLRQHMRMPDGYQRDTVMYSIIRPEWPRVRRELSMTLQRHWEGSHSR